MAEERAPATVDGTTDDSITHVAMESAAPGDQSQLGSLEGVVPSDDEETVPQEASDGLDPEARWVKEEGMSAGKEGVEDEDLHSAVAEASHLSSDGVEMEMESAPQELADQHQQAELVLAMGDESDDEPLRDAEGIMHRERPTEVSSQATKHILQSIFKSAYTETEHYNFSTEPKNVYHKQLFEATQRRDTVTKQVDRVIQQLFQVKQQLDSAEAQFEADRQELYSANSTVAPVEFNVCDYLVRVQGDVTPFGEDNGKELKLPILNPATFLNRTEPSKPPPKITSKPTYARATKASKTRKVFTQTKFKDTLAATGKAVLDSAGELVLPEGDNDSEWGDAEPVHAEWKGKATQGEMEDLMQEAVKFSKKTRGFLRNPRNYSNGDGEAGFSATTTGLKRAAGDLSEKPPVTLITARNFNATTDASVFRPTPAQVVFETYDRFQTVEKKLTLTNTSMTTRQLRLQPIKSDHFTIKTTTYPSGSQGANIAPGMALECVIAFTPSHLGTYAAELAACAENASPFMVPISAQRASPDLSLDSVVDCGITLVGAAQTRHISFENRGGCTRFRIVHASQTTSYESYESEELKNDESFQDSLERPTTASKTARQTLYRHKVDLENLHSLTSYFWMEEYDQLASRTASHAGFELITTLFELDSKSKGELVVNFSPTVSGPNKDFYYIIYDDCTYDELCFSGLAELPDIDISSDGLYDILEKGGLSMVIDDGVTNHTIQRTLILHNHTKVPVEFCLEQHLPSTLGLASHLVDSSSHASFDVNQQLLNTPFTFTPQSGEVEAEECLRLTMSYSPKHDVAETWAGTEFRDRIKLLVRLPQLPMTIRDFALHKQVLIEAVNRPCQVRVTPSVVHVPGEISVFEPYSQTLELANESSSAPLHFKIGSFETETGLVHCEPSQGQVAAAGTARLRLTVTPKREGVLTGSLAISFDKAPTADVPILCTIMGPQVLVEAPAVAFGLCQLGTVASQDIYLFNPCQGQIEVAPRVAARTGAPADSFLNAIEISFEPPVMVIDPGHSVPIKVSIVPGELGTHEAAIIFDVEGSSKLAALSMSCTVQEPRCCFLNPVLSFLDCYAGIQSTVTATIKNLSALEAQFDWRDGLGLLPLPKNQADSLKNYADVSRRVSIQGAAGLRHSHKFWRDTALAPEDCVVQVEPAHGVLKAGEERTIVVTVECTHAGILAPHALIFDVRGISSPLPLCVFGEVQGVLLGCRTTSLTFPAMDERRVQQPICTATLSQSSVSKHVEQLEHTHKEAARLLNQPAFKPPSPWSQEIHFDSIKVRQPYVKVIHLSNSSAMDADISLSFACFGSTLLHTPRFKYNPHVTLPGTGTPQMGGNSGSSSGEQGKATRLTATAAKTTAKLGLKATGMLDAPTQLTRTRTRHGVLFALEEASINVPAHGEAYVRLWCTGDVWGTYHDSLVISGANLDTVVVPVTARVVGNSLETMLTKHSGLAPIVRFASVSLTKSATMTSEVLALDSVQDSDAPRPVDSLDIASATAQSRSVLRNALAQATASSELMAGSACAERTLTVRNPTSHLMAVRWEVFDVQHDDTCVVDLVPRLAGFDDVGADASGIQVNDGVVLSMVEDCLVTPSPSIIKLHPQLHEGIETVAAFRIEPKVAVLAPEETLTFKLMYAPTQVGKNLGFLRGSVFLPSQAPSLERLVARDEPSVALAKAILNGAVAPPFPTQVLRVEPTLAPSEHITPSGLSSNAGMIQRETVSVCEEALRIELMGSAQSACLHVELDDMEVVLNTDVAKLQTKRTVHDHVVITNPTSTAFTVRANVPAPFKVSLVSDAGVSPSKKKSDAVSTSSQRFLTQRTMPGSAANASASVKGMVTRPLNTASGNGVGGGAGTSTLSKTVSKALGSGTTLRLAPDASATLQIDWTVLPARKLLARALSSQPERKQLAPMGSYDVKPSDQDEVSVTFDGLTILQTTELTLQVGDAQEDTLAIPIYARIAMPKLSLSTNVVDFGPCVIGQPHVLTITIMNEGECECDWTASMANTVTSKADVPTFQVVPSSGQLEGFVSKSTKHQAQLQLIFHPAAEAHFTDQLVVRSQLGSTVLSARLTGSGNLDEGHDPGYSAVQ
eukprot:m.60881 g.60881  ORF g.60881 m.60881 type:complete len:2092 (-) comp11839_c0_seq2:564-6839(-)